MSKPVQYSPLSSPKFLKTPDDMRQAALRQNHVLEVWRKAAGWATKPATHSKRPPTSPSPKGSCRRRRAAK